MMAFRDERAAIDSYIENLRLLHEHQIRKDLKAIPKRDWGRVKRVVDHREMVKMPTTGVRIPWSYLTVDYQSSRLSYRAIKQLVALLWAGMWDWIDCRDQAGQRG